MLNHEYLRRSNFQGSDLAWIEEKFRVRDWLVYSPTRSVFLRAFPILKFFQQPEKNKNQFVAPGAGAPSLPTAQKRSAYGNFSLRKNLESGHVGRGERERHGSPDSINSLLASEWNGVHHCRRKTRPESSEAAGRIPLRVAFGSIHERLPKSIPDYQQRETRSELSGHSKS